MPHFTPLSGEVLLQQNGTYRTASVAVSADGELFAQRGNSYYRLGEHGATSNRTLFWRPTADTPEHYFLLGKARAGAAPKAMPASRLKTVTRKRAA